MGGMLRSPGARIDKRIRKSAPRISTELVDMDATEPGSRCGVARAWPSPLLQIGDFDPEKRGVGDDSSLWRARRICSYP